MAQVKDIKILDELHEGYYEVDLQGNLTNVNDVVCKIIKLPRDELLGLNFRDYTSPETAKMVFETCNKVYRTELPQRIEYEIIRRDNTCADLEISIYLLKDAQGRKVGFSGLVTDITARKQLEESLRQSMQRFEALFENANELIITTNKDGYISRLNKKVEEISGYTKEELIGKTILTIAHPEDRKLYIRFWQDLIEGQTPRYELRAVNKDGQIGYLLASGSAIREGGEILEMQYNAQLITDLKQAQIGRAHV
jgi:PAS domain S-box-containing protein